MKLIWKYDLDISDEYYLALMKFQTLKQLEIFINMLVYNNYISLRSLKAYRQDKAGYVRYVVSSLLTYFLDFQFIRAFLIKIVTKGKNVRNNQVWDIAGR